MKRSTDPEAFLSFTKVEFEDLISKAFRAEFQILRNEFQALAASARDTPTTGSALREVAAPPRSLRVSAPSDWMRGETQDVQVLPGSLHDYDDLDEDEITEDRVEECKRRQNGSTILSDDSEHIILSRPTEPPPIAKRITTATTDTTARRVTTATTDTELTAGFLPTGSSNGTMVTAHRTMKAMTRPVFSQWQGKLNRSVRRATLESDLSSQGVGDSCWGRAHEIVMSNGFHYAMCAFIMLNSLTIGAEVDFRVRNPTRELPSVFMGIEVFFGIVFTTELLLRIFVYRCAFFTQPGRASNLFDTGLVCAQLVDLVLALFVQLTTSASFTRSARLIRIFRLARVVRVLRLVNAVQELRKLVFLILASFHSFIWTLILFLILTYLFAVFFSQLVADQAERILKDFGPDDLLFHYFGSLGNSMSSLFQAVTGGVDWEIVSAELMDHISVGLGFVFAAYVAFALLVILNLVTGVFIEGAFKLNKQDKEEELLRKTKRLFKCTSDGRTGIVTKEELLRKIDTNEVRELFSLLETDPKVAENMFDLLDIDNNGELTAAEFVAGALNLKGPARALHIQGLLQVQLDYFNEVLKEVRKP